MAHLRPRYYKGIVIAQSPRAVALWEKILKEVRPKRILEIGTYRWGMSLLFSEHCNEFYTYDIKYHTYRPEKFPPKTRLLKQFKKVDVFSIEEEIGALIQKEGVTLVYCDGGDKIKELATFSEWLKPGDYIAVHDWGTEVNSAPSYLKEVYGKECDEEGMTRIFYA